MTRTLIATLLTTTALALGACVGGPASLGGEPPLTPTSRYQLQVEPDLDRIALAVHDNGLSPAQNGALQELVRRYRYVDAVPMVIEGSLVGEGTNPENAMQSTPVSSQSGKLPAQPLVANEQVAILLPLNTGEGYPVTCAFADQMRSLYPAVDVSQELRAMCGWLIGNPTKRKTKRGITRFITSWLSRCQDKGGSSGLSAQAYQQPAGTLDVDDTSWTKYLQEGF